MTYAAEIAAQPFAQGFTVNPNGHGIHARCNSCGESKASNLVEAWMLGHKEKCSA